MPGDSAFDRSTLCLGITSTGSKTQHMGICEYVNVFRFSGRTLIIIG